MGGISIWHWIILLAMLAVPVILIGLVVWLVKRSSRPSPLQRQAIPPPILPMTPTVEARLQQLDDLRAKGAITDLEHQRQRAEIIKSV